MRTRLETRIVQIGNLALGGSEKVLIQSMSNVKTSRVEEVVAQLSRCQKLGADLMRVSILDEEDAKALRLITDRVDIPLVADIHFDYRLALLSIENGAKAIRLNPGNIGSLDNVRQVVELAKKRRIPIRIGVNAGSLGPYEKKGLSIPEALIEAAKEHVRLLESLDFSDIVISLKTSSVLDTVKAYELAASTFPYPLHLGLTEAGPTEDSLILSSAALSPLLLKGLGDTIRISMSDTPEREIVAAKKLLKGLGLYKGKTPTLISCPTCGRTEVDLLPLSKRVGQYLETLNKDITVAIMGCIVNGPGEAKKADVGLAGGHNHYALFKKGEVIRTLKEDEAYDALIEEIEKL